MKKLYRELGVAIKTIRETAKETIPETSGAVEIDPEDLLKMEDGRIRPDEEILSLLISHFGLEEGDATELWQLAGYLHVKKEDNMADKDDDNKLRINLPNDSQVLYSDMVQVMSNQYGVVLHFLQLSPNQQATVVSRIGMSKEHARSLLELLKRNLEEEDNK